MAADDVYQVGSVIQVNGQNGTVVQHFQVQSGDDGMSELAVCNELRLQFIDRLATWQACNVEDTTYVGLIIQKVHPARGIQYSFVFNSLGQLLQEALPANCGVQIVKRPASGGRTGVGFMTWPGVGKDQTEQGRLGGVAHTAWRNWANVFASIWAPLGGLNVTFRNGVFTRATGAFTVTYILETKIPIAKIRNRTPSSALG